MTLSFEDITILVPPERSACGLGKDECGRMPDRMIEA